MSKLPYLPLFFGDLLAATALWSGEERALYVLLLAYQWTAGPLPREPLKLARMAQYDPAKFRALWKTVGQKFSTSGSGLVNQRLEQHRAKSQQVSEANRDRAKAAAAHRWASRGGSAPSIAESNAIHPILSYPNKEKESEAKNGLFQTAGELSRHTGAQLARIRETKT